MLYDARQESNVTYEYILYGKRTWLIQSFVSRHLQFWGGFLFGLGLGLTHFAPEHFTVLYAVRMNKQNYTAICIMLFIFMSTTPAKLAMKVRWLVVLCLTIFIRSLPVCFISEYNLNLKKWEILRQTTYIRIRIYFIYGYIAYYIL